MALMEMAVSIVCRERDHQSGSWGRGLDALGKGQTLYPINTCQTHKSLLSFSLVVFQLLLLPSPSCQENLLFTKHTEASQATCAHQRALEIPVWPLISCLTWDKSLHFSKPQCLYR